MGTNTTERKAPDKSKEAKLQRALDAVNAAASAFFSDGDTETALEIRKAHENLKAIQGNAQRKG